MPEDRDLKLFISWSGALAKGVANDLRAWIPLVSDKVKPWMSDQDIEAGQRAMNRIEAELEDTGFGIIVVTQENRAAPWLNFEAGALSKAITTDREQRVAPLLVDIDSAAQLTGPLTQFQANTFGIEGIRSIMRSVGSVAGVPQEMVDARVEMSWSRLADSVEKTRALVNIQKAAPKRTTDEMLEEVLSLMRDMSLRASMSWMPEIKSRRSDFVLSPQLTPLGDDELITEVSQLVLSRGVHPRDIRIHRHGNEREIEFSIYEPVDPDLVTVFGKGILNGLGVMATIYSGRDEGKAQVQRFR
jgi:hypothetical protein